MLQCCCTQTTVGRVQILYHSFISTTVGGLERYNKGIMDVRKFLHNSLLQPFASVEIVSFPDYFSAQGGKKIVWSSSLFNHLFHFHFVWFKNW